jgi:hypothetical protein
MHQDASIRCMHHDEEGRPTMITKRTTVAADADDLYVIEREAKRRGVSVSHMLREAVAEYAVEIRAKRAPRFGVAEGPPDLSQMTVDQEDAPYLDPDADPAAR